MKKLISIVLLVVLAGLAACQPATPAVVAQPTVSAVANTSSPAVLTLVGAKATRSMSLDEIMALPAVEGQAGIKSSTGKITPPSLFKGVLLSELVKQVGGADSTMGVQVEAKDGYAMTLSYDQINKGDFIAYDPGTGDEIKDHDALQVIIAYEMDGKTLDAETDGALRMMVISAKANQVVDGHWSVKFINKITVKPLAAEWSLVLQGAITDEVDRGSFESCSTSKCHGSSYQDDKSQVWTGTPLYYLVGRVDDETKHGDGAYNRALVEVGYTIELIGKDGFSVKLDSKQVEDNKNILLANQMNNNQPTDKDFPLKLVGTGLDKNQMVGGIEKIIIHLAQAPTATAAPTTAPAATEAGATNPTSGLTLSGLVGKEQNWSIADLKKLNTVKETVEHPKKGKQDVAGVLLSLLLDMAGIKPEAKSLVFYAADGYTAEVDLASVKACKTCLVAFDESGGFKSVMPDLASGLWVKDLTKIEIK